MTTTRTATPRTASPRQVENIEKFRTRKVLTATAIDLLNTYDLDPTARNAGRVLDYLFDASTPWLPTPRPATVTTPEVTEPGLYTHGAGDEIYRVKRSRNSGHLYAQRLDGTDWIYEGARPLRTLPLVPLTKEQAQAYGRQTGVCCVCGAELTNPVSVQAGIGPICGGRL